MNKIRKGDQVIVLTGRDKGKRGAVTQRVDEERVLVEGVNLVKKHVKPNPMKGTTGGVVEKAMSIHQSNIAIFNPATGKADRVGIKLLADPKTNKTTRVRVYKSSGEEIKA
jgi:large subunit ribosomal protein L24